MMDDASAFSVSSLPGTYISDQTLDILQQLGFQAITQEQEAPMLLGSTL